MRGLKTRWTISLVFVLSAWPALCGQAQNRTTSIVIAEQGSFFIGGTEVIAPGKFDPTRPITSDEGFRFQIDHLYAQFQIPEHPRQFPLVMIHGAGQTGKTWESTPDGRDGYQTIFLRRGFAVYIVDFPRRAKAGFPSFNGPLGALLGAEIIPDRTSRFGDQRTFIAFRLGPEFLQYFPGSQFPRAGLDQFLRQTIPYVTDDDDVVSDALAALLERIGPAILVSHSQSGRFACLTAIKSPNVKAIIDYEGGTHPFPEGESPDPLPTYDGSLVRPGAPVPAPDFQRLTKIPIQIVEGDYIPKTPIPNLILDTQRVKSIYRRQFVDNVNQHGGRASFLSLPELGLHGNGHFAFSDLNNVEVADLLSQFLRQNGLDARKH